MLVDIVELLSIFRVLLLEDVMGCYQMGRSALGGLLQERSPLSERLRGDLKESREISANLEIPKSVDRPTSILAAELVNVSSDARAHDAANERSGRPSDSVTESRAAGSITERRPAPLSPAALEHFRETNVLGFSENIDSGFLLNNKIVSQ